MKQVMGFISFRQLHIVCNISFMHQVFPEDMKLADIGSLLQETNEHDINNYCIELPYLRLIYNERLRERIINLIMCVSSGGCTYYESGIYHMTVDE